MYIFSKHGFFSIIQTESGEVHVRGRVKRDLDNLRRELAIGRRVSVSSKADYKYRLIIDAEMRDQLFHVLSQSIDYPNFKAMIASLRDQRDKSQVYRQIWELMYTFQID